ncbi:MAG TPA: hypothetical protein EYQ54_10685 [Myxococcales bacterium]|nr:hypothetical protein [Myxococcales bacterium]HIL80491.1 hypothetical protein [Myxococcales bacterium]
MGTLNAIYRRFQSDVDFYVIYIREIHPTDGWQVEDNENEGVLFRQHQSMDERIQVGEACMVKLALEMPALVDAMDDGVATAYAGVPERLYVVGRDGRVAYKGGMGPMFFKPREWEQRIADCLAADASAG